MIKIIPAIDIIEGKCVRLVHGDFSRKKMYNEDPLEAARQFEDAGIQKLHLVDLDGARTGRIVNHRILEKIAGQTALEIDFGGGIQSDEDVRIAFESGVSQVTGGSVAVKNRPLFERWLQHYGPEKIILGLDGKDRKIAIDGWQTRTEISLLDFLEENIEKGIAYAICTDIAKDGALEGPSFELYADIRDQFPELKLIASGGVTSIEDLEKLEEGGLYGAIIGKALYEGTIKLNDLKPFLC